MTQIFSSDEHALVSGMVAGALSVAEGRGVFEKVEVIIDGHDYTNTVRIVRGGKAFLVTVTEDGTE